MYKKLEAKHNRLKKIKKEKCERLFNLEVAIIKSRIKEIDDKMECGYFTKMGGKLQKNEQLMHNQIKDIKDKLEREIQILNSLQDDCSRLETDIKSKSESLDILDEKLKTLRYKMSDLKKQKGNVKSIKRTLKDSYNFFKGKSSHSKQYILLMEQSISNEIENKKKFEIDLANKMNKKDPAFLIDESIKVNDNTQDEISKLILDINRLKPILLKSEKNLNEKREEYIRIKSMEETKVINLRDHSDDNFMKQYFPSIYNRDLNKYLN